MFRQRSNKKELLDEENIREPDLFQNLRELHTINSRLGGYNISLKALNAVINKTGNTTVVDIGSGGGDSLSEMQKWAVSKGYELRLYGIDLKESCVNYARAKHVGTGIVFVQDDYRNLSRHIAGADIIHACLFCHHLSNAEIEELIRFCILKKCRLVINDLHRHFLAYYSIKLLTRLFSRSHLVKNDAPLSVLRGFKKKEWMGILNKSGAKKFTVKWRWAFRHEVIVYG